MSLRELGDLKLNLACNLVWKFNLSQNHRSSRAVTCYMLSYQVICAITKQPRFIEQAYFFFLPHHKDKKWCQPSTSTRARCAHLTLAHRLTLPLRPPSVLLTWTSSQGGSCRTLAEIQLACLMNVHMHIIPLMFALGKACMM